MQFIKAIKKSILPYLPINSAFLYKIGKTIIDCCNGDNDDNMSTNGEFRFMREILPGAEIVFDVGANLGDWTREALKINSYAKFYCFEPSRSNFRVLSANNSIGNVTVNNIGFGERREERELFISEKDSGNSSLYHRQCNECGGVGKKELVQIETVDGYCRKNDITKIDFMKVDVEGHELAVLKGSAKMLAQGLINVIQFEYGGTYIDSKTLLKDVWEYVTSLTSRYYFYKIYPHEIVHMKSYKPTFETFQYSNWVIMLRNT